MLYSKLFLVQNLTFLEKEEIFFFHSPVKINACFFFKTESTSCLYLGDVVNLERQCKDTTFKCTTVHLDPQENMGKYLQES